MKNKYFSIKSISVATYLGGPLAGGILVSLNFKRFQQNDKAFWTLIISFLATLVLMWAIFQIPDSMIEKVPNFLIPLLYTPIVAFIAEKLQKQEIQKLEEQEGEKEHWWKAAGVGLLGAILTFAISFQIASSEPPFSGEKFLYGELEHEIYYQGESIDEAFLHSVAVDLERIGYFTNDFTQAAHIEEWKTRYIFSIYIDETFWENEEVLEQLRKFKKKLEQNTTKEVTLKMLHPTLTEVKERRI